jgi:molecular chaperone Hsp33
MNDYLVRAIAKTENVRALACITTGLADEARRRHGTWPTASAALGRALTGGTLLGALLKTGQRVALKFEGNGPLKKIIVEADSSGGVHGYVAVPEVHMVTREGKLDVGGALGRAGFLTVTKDLRLKEPYSGMVQLYTGEIGEDLALYLTESEQVPSAVGLGVFVETDNRVSASGGFLIQTLPPVHEEVVDALMDHIEKLPPITQLLRDGNSPEQLLDILLSGIPFDILEKRDLVFRCTCSREKVERALVSLGAKELSDIIDHEGGTEATCEFCRERYLFTEDDLAGLLREIGP